VRKWILPPDGGHMDRASGVYLQNMTGYALRERLKVNDIIIIPIGSTEYHGLNAPYGEDTFLVTRMAEAVALQTGCTVCQPIWFGSHPYQHLGVPGTIVVPEDIFVGTLRAVIAGLWNTGFRKQILLNGHGQEYVIPNAIHEFAKKYQVPAILVNVNWPIVIPDYLKDRKHGGPFETPFRHADEAETSYSLALFPELVDQSKAEETDPKGFIKREHVDVGGDIFHRPVPGHCQVGMGGIEVAVYPQGVLGKPALASADKALPGLKVLLDYLKTLHDDIVERFPPGELPPAELVTQRPKQEVDALLRGPQNGGRHLYTVAWPP